MESSRLENRPTANYFRINLQEDVATLSENAEAGSILVREAGEPHAIAGCESVKFGNNVALYDMP